MSVEAINEAVHVCKYLGDKKTSKLIEGDIIIPDIKPDILSIVRVRKKVYIGQVIVEDGKISIKGTINFGVIYIADDDTNSQKGVNHELEFEEVINFPEINSNSIVRLKVDTGNSEYRVINSRKISVKVPLTFCIKAFNNCEINIVKGITDDEDIELQKESCNICSSVKKAETRGKY